MMCLKIEAVWYLNLNSYKDKCVSCWEKKSCYCISKSSLLLFDCCLLFLISFPAGNRPVCPFQMLKSCCDSLKPYSVSCTGHTRQTSHLTALMKEENAAERGTIMSIVLALTLHNTFISQTVILLKIKCAFSEFIRLFASVCFFYSVNLLKAKSTSSNQNWLCYFS